MRVPGRFSLAQLLYALCGIWVAIAPVAPRIHQTIAKHRHVYCREHNRVEDEAVREVGGRFVATWHPEGTRVLGFAPSSTVGASGLECLFSNFLAHAVLRAFARSITGSLPTELARACVREVDLRSAKTYRIAPKNSPPSAV